MDGVIITGPTGAIGIAIIEKCIGAGVKVLAICHRESRRIAVIPKHPLVTVIEVNLDELRTIQNTSGQQYEAFFHLGWQGTTGNARNDMYLQIENIQYTMDAVEVAERFHCKTFVGAGSQAEYGRVDGIITPETKTNPENGYGMAKLCAGQMSRKLCTDKNIRHIWARIFSVYGPGDSKDSMIMSTLIKMLHNEKTSFTKAEQIWEYLYSEDAAEMLIRLANNGRDKNVYCLSSGKPNALRKYIELMYTMTNTNQSMEIGMIEYGSSQVMHLEADISKTVKDTGYTPLTSFEEGIKKVINTLI